MVVKSEGVKTDVNLLIALSLGVHREQLEHLIGLT
jgi:hypothetical protein